METRELIAKAMKGRTIYRAAKDWGMPITTLTQYVKGGRLPDFSTAILIADEVGIDHGQMLEMLAQEEKTKKAAIPKGKAASRDESVLVV